MWFDRLTFYFGDIAKTIGIIILIIIALAVVVIAASPPAAGTVPVPETVNATLTDLVYEEYKESPEDQRYRTNGHLLGEDFSWRRDDVSGSKDMIVHASVYGYRMEPNYKWWSVSWGRYFTQVPADGMKYLFVYVNVWMEGDSTNWDPRIYGFDKSHFLVQIKETLFSDDPEYSPPIRIKELEETSTRFDTTRIGPFGCLRMNENGKESCIDGQYIRMGQENGLDGFIVYQIPRETRPEDIIVLGQFRGFGSAWWQLT